MSILQALLLSLTRRDRYRLASGLPTAIAVPIASDRYRLAPRDRYRLASRLPIAIRQPRASRPLSLSRLILPELAAHYRIFSPERTTRALNTLNLM